MSSPLLAAFWRWIAASRPLACDPADWARHPLSATQDGLSVFLYAQDTTLHVAGALLTLPSASHHTRLHDTAARQAAQEAGAALIAQIRAHLPYFAPGTIQLRETCTPTRATWALELGSHTACTGADPHTLATRLEGLAQALHAVPAGTRSCTVHATLPQATTTFTVRRPEDAATLWSALVQPRHPEAHILSVDEVAWKAGRRIYTVHDLPLYPSHVAPTPYP